MSAIITCTATNCTSSPIQLSSMVSPLCSNFVPTNASAAQNLILDQTFFCSCYQVGNLQQSTCNFTFVGKYAFGVANTNLTVISQEADIQIQFTVSNTPTMQLYCGVFDNGYSAVWGSAGGCKPSRTESPNQITYTSCFGNVIAVDTAVLQKVPLFSVEVADVYNNVENQIVLPISISNANVVAVQSNSSSMVAFNQTTNQLVLAKLPLGVYSPTIIFKDQCETTYVYNEQLKVYNLNFRSLDILQNVDCSASNCVFKATLAGIAVFSRSLCQQIYFIAPAVYDFNQADVCNQVDDSLFVSFIRDFNIFNGATILMNFDNVSRVNMQSLTYLADFRIRLQLVPVDSVLVINPYCVNKEYANLGPNDIVQNGTYVDFVAEVANPYGCIRRPVLVQVGADPVSYNVTYFSCFNRNFSQVVTQQLLDAPIVESGQPYLVSGNNFTILLNVSALSDKFNFVLISDFSIQSGSSVIQASSATYTVPGTLRLYFQLNEGMAPGVYYLVFADSNFCGGDFQIRLMINGNQLELFAALLFRPQSAQNNVQMFDISNYNGSVTGLSFIGDCTILGLFEPLLPYIYQRQCLFSGSNVSITLANFYVPSNSSSPSKYSVVSKAVVQGAANIAVLFEFVDELFSQARRDLELAVLCDADQQKYFIPNAAADFFQISPVFDSFANTAVINVISRFDQRLSVVKSQIIPIINFTTTQTGLMICNYVQCYDNAVVVTVNGSYVNVTGVSLIDTNQNEIPLTQTEASVWEIRLLDYRLYSGTYQTKVSYTDFCGTQYSMTGNETVVVQKEILLVLYSTTAPTYSYVRFLLQGDSSIRIDGAALSTPSYTKRYICEFADAAGVQQSIGVTSTIQVDIASGTLFADYQPDSQYIDGAGNVSAPDDIRQLCEGTRFNITLRAGSQDVGGTIQFILTEQPQTECVASAGVHSRSQSSFAAKITMCTDISPYLISNNGKSAGDVDASNDVVARMENGQAIRQTMVVGGVLSNLTISTRNFLSLPQFVKAEMLQRASNSEAKKLLAPYYIQPRDSIPEALRFFPVVYRLFELLKQTNETALQMAFLDLEQVSHSLCPLVGVPSNQYLQQITRLRGLNASAAIAPFFRTIAQNAQVQEGLDFSTEFQGKAIFASPANAQPLTQINVRLNNQTLAAFVELKENGVNIARRNGMYLFESQNVLHGSHSGDVLLTVPTNVTCSAGSACRSVFNGQQTACTCTANGSFAISVKVVAAAGFPGWAIAVIVIAILLVIAVALIVVLLIRNGGFQRRRRIARITSANAVFA